jgi:superfamily II DNA or RNA helicase
MPDQKDIDQSIAAAEAELGRLNVKRAELIARLQELHRARALLAQSGVQLSLDFRSSVVTNQSTEDEKIALFQSLFKGRADVYPRRFESVKTAQSGYSPACANEWIPQICHKPRIKCSECTNQAFLPADEAMIRSHLLGQNPSESTGRDFTAGVYPLLLDETCWFLAADFDKSTWQEDATAFLEICQIHNVPAVLERSRSGSGGHVWIFFSEPIPAKVARRLGSYLLTRTMEHRPEIGFDSYDRFFPSQDTLPQGGYGNLIALPLQKGPRARGNSVFVDEDFEPYEDQWAFLSSIRRIDLNEIEAILAAEIEDDNILGVKIALPEEEAPWIAPPSRKRKERPLTGPLPEKLSMVFGNQLYVAKDDLTPSLRNRLIRLAAFQNPEFYRAQAMRFSTFDKPRIICCAEEFPKHIGLPRGCLEEIVALLETHNIKPELIDERFQGNPIEVEFQGELRPDQQVAVEAMSQTDSGVLSATTGFGKTVIAAYLIAKRKVNTLVLVHRRQLLDQWIAHLVNFLGLTPQEIGQFGGGKQRQSGVVDVATIQSLHAKGVVNDLVGEYGHLVIDECHHISARSFELVARQSNAKYITGLSATVTRKDGHHPIIFMQCGPVRFRVDPRQQAAKRPFQHRVIVRRTDFRLSETYLEGTRPSIQEIYKALSADKARNAQIIEDVLDAIEAGRSPLILTERRDHLKVLAEQLQPYIQNIFVLKGGMGRKQRRHLQDRLSNVPENESRVILSTGRYLGEGFDDARLDTLFLTLPISWRGTLAQYAGRLHREHDQKKEVIIYDYLDEKANILARMFEKRKRGYKALGYEIEG